MATAALNRYTPEEYLALERNAEFKSEYLNGRIIAMTGATLEHAEIVLKVGSDLRARLRPRGCRVFINDVRAQIASISGYVYPDVMVLCGTPAILNTRPPTLTNPNSSSRFSQRQPRSTIAERSSRHIGRSSR